MSTPLSNLVRQLGSAGCSIEQIAVAVEHQEQQIIEADRTRKQKNAARQTRYRNVTLRHMTSPNVTSHDVTQHDVTLRHDPISTGNSAGKSDDQGERPADAHIDNTLTKDSIKKVSKKVYLCADIPEKPPEEATTFAKDEGGWLLERTLREWQRFRDYQISKNKKHNSLVALLASWRNWVRSPFQSTGAANGGTVWKNGRQPSAITAALEQHTRDIANSFDECGETRPTPPRLISHG